MIRSVVGAILSIALLIGATSSPTRALPPGACCLCLQCVLPAPPDCTRPLAADCAAVCSQDGCSDVAIGTPQECASAPLCPGAALPAPAVTGWPLAGVVALLAAIAGAHIRRRRPAS